MTTLIWLYQFIGAVFLGYMCRSAIEVKPKLFEWTIVVISAIFWPCTFWLIYRAEMKK